MDKSVQIVRIALLHIDSWGPNNKNPGQQYIVENNV